VLSILSRELSDDYDWPGIPEWLFTTLSRLREGMRARDRPRLPFPHADATTR
jgi:hypothetical protein